MTKSKTFLDETIESSPQRVSTASLAILLRSSAVNFAARARPPLAALISFLEWISLVGFFVA